MPAKRRGRRGRKPSRARDETDRSFVATTYMASVCDSVSLQPLLPQIVLSKYSQHGIPPANLRAQYESFGFPFRILARHVGPCHTSSFQAVLHEVAAGSRQLQCGRMDHIDH